MLYCPQCPWASHRRCIRAEARHRCVQAVPLKAARYPHRGVRMLGVPGLPMFLAVALVPADAERRFRGRRQQTTSGNRWEAGRIRLRRAKESRR